MEFKNVFIINCIEEYIPHKSSMPQGIEEERRLMYVGITRTIENLFICIPKTIRGKVMEISRFVKESGLSTYKGVESGFVKGDRVIHSAFGAGEVIETDKEEISIKFSDGLIRRFDALILVNNKLIEKIKS